MGIRLLRGQVVVREVAARASVIYLPDGKQREITTHRGTVLAKGPPALHPKGGEIQHGFEVGDLVSYHWEHNEEAFTVPWPEDGRPASWVPQRCIDAVLES